MVSDNQIDKNNLTPVKPNSKRKFYQYWRFWITLFVVIVVLIWVAVSILLAYLNSRSDNSANDTTISMYSTKIYSTTDPSLGNKSAALQVVEFSDFQCPYCAQAHSIVRELVKNFPDDIYFIYRDFPIDDIHPQARLAAEAAQCAYDQGKFWEYHDLLFQNQAKLDLGYLLVYGQRLNLDLTKFTTCLEENKYSNEVSQDLSDGYDVGVRATPTFFINGEKIEGVIPYESWVNLINLSKNNL